MAQHIQKSLIYRLIIAFLCVSAVSSQCCDFLNNPCTWDETSWSMSNDKQPDVTQYPNFASSETDPYFLYIQDQSGSTQSSTTFSIPSDGTVINFDYFFDSPIEDPDNYFYIEFYNTDGSYSTWLLTVNTPSATWQHAQLTCNSQNNYCCGSTDNLPCEGTLRIVANVDATSPQALIAIDTIGTTDCSSLTTAGPSTSSPSPLTSTVEPPMPIQYDCCFFYSDTCPGSSGDWYWSKEDPTTNVQENYDYFMWTNSNDTVWTSPTQYNVTSGTQFSFQYFFEYNNAYLIVGFEESISGMSYEVEMVPIDYSYWDTYSFNCSSCCGTSSVCDGQVTITAQFTDENYAEVAIDNFGRDTLCYGTLECCTFDDPSLCGSVSEVQDGYQWIFSGDKYPSYPLPSPGSEFVYFEAINATSALSVLLQTDLITLYDDSTFSFKCYIYNSAYVINSLYVYFYNVDTGSKAEVYKATTTSSEWLYLGGDVGFACEGFNKCSGSLEFVANVDVIGSHVVFGIDSLNMDSNCGE